jgi:hypothetical protein
LEETKERRRITEGIKTITPNKPRKEKASIAKTIMRRVSI